MIAEEVRSLAQRSADAARTTSAMIEESVANSSSGVKIAQDENTSIVYGMPKEAFEIGAVDAVLPIEDVAQKMLLVTLEKKMIRKVKTLA